MKNFLNQILFIELKCPSPIYALCLSVHLMNCPLYKISTLQTEEPQSTLSTHLIGPLYIPVYADTSYTSQVFMPCPISVQRPLGLIIQILVQFVLSLAPVFIRIPPDTVLEIWTSTKLYGAVG